MENNIDTIANDLVQRASVMAAGAAMDAKDMLHPEIDEFVRQSLKTGSELMLSCASLAHGANELAVNVLTRSIIELSLKMHWATFSSENAKHLLAISTEQMKAFFVVNAKTGIIKVVDREGNDFTTKFLSSGRAERGQKPISIEIMARQAGLIDLYNVFYRLQSMHTHSHCVFSVDTQTSALTLNSVGAFSVLLGHIGVSWLVHRNRPDNEKIRSLLGLNDSVSP